MDEKDLKPTFGSASVSSIGKSSKLFNPRLIVLSEFEKSSGKMKKVSSQPELGTPERGGGMTYNEILGKTGFLKAS